MSKRTETLSVNSSDVTLSPQRRSDKSTHSDTHHESTVKLPQEIKNLLAGGVAGMIAKTVVAPMDRIKIMYQVSSRPFYLKEVPSVVQNIIQSEGITALWRGNLATMIRVFPYAGIQFMVFNKCKEFFLGSKGLDYNSARVNPVSNDDKISNKSNANQTIIEESSHVDAAKWKLSSFESLISGSFAGACSVLLTYPLDLARAQLAVSKKSKAVTRPDGFVQVLINNHTKGGIGGLFRGVTPTLLGILPYSGIAFTINEQTKRQIFSMNGRDPTTFEKVQCGAISGLLAQSLTYPLEVTRRRMQTNGITPTFGKEAPSTLTKGKCINNQQSQTDDTTSKRLSNRMTGHTSRKSTCTEKVNPPTMLRTMKHVMSEQGTIGFFKGLSMNWMKGPISFGISFTTFDLLQDLLKSL